jgi:hypothetical protein
MTFLSCSVSEHSLDTTTGDGHTESYGTGERREQRKGIMTRFFMRLR